MNFTNYNNVYFQELKTITFFPKFLQITQNMRRGFHSREDRKTQNFFKQVKISTYILSIIQLFAIIINIFILQLKPFSFTQQYKIFRPITKINKSKIFYVYHRGGSYIDPVDPKGERCLIPYDYTKDITKANLIVYNALDNYRDISNERDPNLRPDQLTCLQSMESTTNYPNIYSNRKSFNYTMLYSLYSDVPIPYAEFFESNEKPLNISEKKGHLLCAFISNCHATNGRKDYVTELMKYIKVDSYGRCLTNSEIPSEMKRAGDKYRVKEAVIRYYKFTIAFENSNDPDYISEKLFQPLRYGSVPIFRGCNNLADFAPPHSTIDANDFRSPKELAEYLLYLDKNDTAYNEYFQWKYDNDIGNIPRIRFFRDRSESSLCALVERIHGLWINPYLTGDWKRKTESLMTCNKCLDDFDLEHRRIPVLRSDGWTYEYPLGDYWSRVLNVSTDKSPEKPIIIPCNTSDKLAWARRVSPYMKYFLSIFPPFY